MIAFNTNMAFTGSLKTNPFHYQKFSLRSIRIVQGSHVVVALDTTGNVQSYITTIRALIIDENGPGIPLEDCQHLESPFVFPNVEKGTFCPSFRQNFLFS